MYVKYILWGIQMQQKIEFPQQLVAGAKVAPKPARGEPDDYDDGLLATGGPIMIGAIGVALAIAAMTFVASGEALFAVAICVVYTAMFFGVPIMMLRMRSGHDARWQRDTPHKRKPVVTTYTGLIGRREAIVQMVIVPVGVSFAFGAFALIWVLARPW